MFEAHDQPRIIHYRSLEELAESLKSSWQSVCECTAKFLREVYEFDLRQGYREEGFEDTADWLDYHCGISRVTTREKVRVAKCLVILSKVEEAFAKGEISYSKVRALVRTAKVENEAELLSLARTMSGTHLERRLSELRNGKSSRVSDAAHEERRLWSFETDGDRTSIRVDLPKAEAMLVLEAIEKCKRELDDSGLEHEAKWDHVARSADALVLMARRCLTSRFRGIRDEDESNVAEVVDVETGELVRDSAESLEAGHLVMVHVDESALRGGVGASDLPVHTMKRLLCDRLWKRRK